MPVRRVGTWKDGVRRAADACVAAMMPGGARLFSVLLRVDGYLYPHEAVFLYQVARRAPGNGPIVEVGSFRGRSTLCLAAGVRMRGQGRVVSVDPHVYGTDRELRENLEHFGAADVVEVVVARSVDTARARGESARAVFLDGDHGEEAVERDVEAWFPRLRPGGLLMLHDATELGGFEGPRRIAMRRVRIGPEFDAVGRIGTIAWGRKSGAPPDSAAPPAHGAWLDPWIARLRRPRPPR